MKPCFKSVRKRRRRVSLYLPEDLRTKVSTRAKADHRSFNNYVVHVLSEVEHPAGK